MSTLIIPAEGPVPCRVLVVGERPGKDEAKWGRPFVGKAGKELDRYLARDAGLCRDEVRVTNTVLDYRYGDPNPEPWEIERDRPALLAEIAKCRPEVVAAVGRFAARWFLGDNIEMESCHGIPRRVQLCTHCGYQKLK